MIEIIGQQGTSEYNAAIAIRIALSKAFPGLEDCPSEDDHVKIAAGVKLSGHKISDIDIVVAGIFRTKRVIVPRTHARDVDGNSLVGKPVRIRSIVAALEVKSHGETGLKIEAGGVSVKYKDGWKSATQQNDDQKYALGQYLQEMTGTNPWVYRCVLLQGISELPKHRGQQQPAAGAVAGSFDATSLLVAMAAVNGIRKHGAEATISSGDQGTLERILDDPLFLPIVPSALDQKKMLRIAARPTEARELAAFLGEHRVHLRGHGGTGKTVLLLQTAYEAFVQQGKRSLVLTYNTALAADIQRTLALMAIPSDGDGGGITVRTVMSFMFSWLDKLGLGGEITFGDYVQKCQEALEYFEKDALSDAEIGKIKAASPDEFSYDAVLVDEAQDWPQPEADLLARLYGGNTIALADGIAQLIRGRATNWKSSVAGLPKTGSKHLEYGLRMKSNLCLFANTFAAEAGIAWHVGVNNLAAGGRVIVVASPYHELSGLQAELLADAIKAGNMPIDMLHCVPPSAVEQSGPSRDSLLGKAFKARTWEVWDGVDEQVRRNFLRSVNSFRILQYESCRGLEGWTTVLDGLDEFWSLKRDEVMHGLAGDGDPTAVAWRSCMIPITRSIDTLVISVRNPSSIVAKVLFHLSIAFPDFVEFRK